MIDQPRAVRDPLDEAALGAYLQDALGWAGPVALRQFPSGFSNLTYLVTDEASGAEAVLRRPPPGADVKGGHDMGREHGLLSKLHGRVPVPRPLAFEASGEVLGAPFYVMERVEGSILRGDTPPNKLPDPEGMARLAEAFVETFAGLHRLDLEEARLDTFGRPEGYVRRQVEGWTGRYARAQTDEVPELEAAFAWLAEHAPEESGASLIHNDFKIDNLVLDPGDTGRVRAILDWELATVGDPLMDLGSTLGYWVEEADSPVLLALGFSPTAHPGCPDREALVALYARARPEAAGLLERHGVFYFVYGLAKLAVIAQQIYKRHAQGLTTDPRFGSLIYAVRACGDTAGRAIETGRVSGLFG